MAGRRLVYHFANRYAPGNLINDDVVQSGFEGLLKAAIRFDPERGVNFTTFASHYIMGEMRHYIRKEATFYRPGWIVDLQRMVNEAIEERLKATGEAPSLQEIAKSLNVSEEGVHQAMRVGWMSLEEIDLSKIQHLYAGLPVPIEDLIAIKEAIKNLNELQRKVISLIYYRDMTQAEAAKRLGISQRKVSRVLQRSLGEMARMMS